MGLGGCGNFGLLITSNFQDLREADPYTPPGVINSIKETSNLIANRVTSPVANVR